MRKATYAIRATDKAEFGMKAEKVDIIVDGRSVVIVAKSENANAVLSLTREQAIQLAHDIVEKLERK